MLITLEQRNERNKSIYNNMCDLDWLEQQWYDKFRTLGFGYEDAIIFARLQAQEKREEEKESLDWLVQEWYDKLRTLGCRHDEAVLLARMKAEMERNITFISAIREDGFDGFCRWAERHCRDIYYNIKGILRSAWNWFCRLF